MKKFSKFMAEAGQPEIPNEPTYGRNPSNGYLNPEVIVKLNAVVGRIFEEDQFDPQARLALMRGSLSKIGLTFGQYRECGKCEDGDYSSIMTGPDGEQRQEYIVCPYCLKLINDSMQYLGNWQDKD